MAIEYEEDDDDDDVTGLDGRDSRAGLSRRTPAASSEGLDEPCQFRRGFSYSDGKLKRKSMARQEALRLRLQSVTASTRRHCT